MRRAALEGLQPFSASKRARRFSASVRNTSRSIAQLERTFNDFLYNWTACHTKHFQKTNSNTKWESSDVRTYIHIWWRILSFNLLLGSMWAVEASGEPHLRLSGTLRSSLSFSLHKQNRAILPRTYFSSKHLMRDAVMSLKRPRTGTGTVLLLLWICLYRYMYVHTHIHIRTYMNKLLD